MTPHRLPLLLLATFALSSPAASAQSGEQAERIGASFVLALGRAPTSGEIDHWLSRGPLSISELVARHKQQLQGDADRKRATLLKACADAFGREPVAHELDTWSAGNRTYTELMQQHLQWLAGHADDYRQVVERAYRLVLQRPPYAMEFDYWNARPILSFALLNGCIEDWARRNAPGLTVTAGPPTVSVHSRFLATFRLSPPIAAEARTATGLVPAGDANLAAAVGRNLVAPGAGSVATSGGMHFVAAGGAGLLATK